MAAITSKRPAAASSVSLGIRSGSPWPAANVRSATSRAVLVHAKDQLAQAFYRKYGFESSPLDEFHLYLLMKDIRANLASIP